MRFAPLPLLLAGFLVVSCGPVEYLSQVTQRASMAVEEARTVEAEKYAPYEWWSAVTYLHKARDMAGVADFEAAIDFGRKAEKHAKEARKIAMERSAEGSDVSATTTPPAPVLRPAPVPTPQGAPPATPSPKKGP